MASPTKVAGPAPPALVPRPRHWWLWGPHVTLDRMFADLLPAIAKPVAKAVAAFIVPWILVGIAWVSTKLGVDIEFDPTWAETTITSVLVAVATYWTTNVKPVEQTPLVDRP